MHEKLVVQQIIGFVIVLVASFAIAVNNFKQFKMSKALVPVIIAVVFMDAVSIIVKYVYQQTEFYPSYMCFSFGMGLGGICLLLMKFQDNKRGLVTIRKSIKKLLPLFIVAELINLAAEFTLNLAISKGPVSMVKVIENIQPVFVLLIALALYPFAPRFFREAEAGKHLQKFALMLIAFAGLVIIGIAS